MGDQSKLSMFMKDRPYVITGQGAARPSRAPAGAGGESQEDAGRPAAGRDARRLAKLAVCEPKPPGQPAADGSEGLVEQCFAVKFHSNMTMVAASFADGTIRVCDPSAAASTAGGAAAGGGPAVLPLLHSVDTRSKLPTMKVRFRPGSRAAGAARNVLVSVGASGSIQHWHLSSQKCLHTIREDCSAPMPGGRRRTYRNQIFALEYSPDGEHFATAGKDCAVRLYDENTKSHVSTFSQNLLGTARGHQGC